MKEQSSKKVGHLSSMINTESTAIGDKEGSDNCNFNSNINTTADNNNDQQYSGEMTLSKKVSTSCEQNNIVNDIAADFNSISILESSSKMQQYPIMGNSSSGLSASLPAPRAPFLSSRPITSQDKLNNIPEVKLPDSVLSSYDAIPYGSLRDSTSQSYSIGGIGGRRDKWLGPKSWHPNNNRFGNDDVCNDDEAPSEIPQSLTALKVMTQITSESKKKEVVESINEQTEKEGDEDEDDSCQFDLELDS